MVMSFRIQLSFYIPLFFMLFIFLLTFFNSLIPTFRSNTADNIINSHSKKEARKIYSSIVIISIVL
jgi:hypothetical protein